METEIVPRNPRDLKLLDVNARYMTHAQFKMLVDNVKRDGKLTSVPLVYADPQTGQEIVLSGNHRVKAAAEAELDPIQVMLITSPLTKAQQTAIQLSHNAISGQDDLPTLKLLYDSIDDVDERAYAGLDDDTLELLDTVDLAPMNEGQVKFATMQIMFTEPELEAVQESLNLALKMSADVRTVANYDDFERFINRVEDTRNAYRIGNLSTAIEIMLGIFEDHITDLHDGILTDENPNTGAGVSGDIILTHQVPRDAAKIITEAISKADKNGDGSRKAPWLIIERLCADYLAGA